MSKRSLYTIVTPLPPTISRATAVDILHDHGGMIELNPLVIKYEKCKPPPNAPPDEFHCTWYELTDKITYLPGIKGQVNYKACFHDLPRSLQTHVYAPAGLEIKEKWSIGGNEAHEEREVIEIGMAGLGVPRSGLYLREDVDMRCNIFLTNFVKKTLKRAHQVLVDRMVVKVDLADDRKVREAYVRGSQCGENSDTSSLRSPIAWTTYDTRPARGVADSSLHRAASVASDGTSSDANATAYLPLAELPGLPEHDPEHITHPYHPAMLAPPAKNCARRPSQTVELE
ncbi:hypothetical protein BDV97DRAFT_88646 [Delphinella strobiligena]|nr:hypothetical protein BDV97DRAFT_88646 [Delphinella strobiligena]